MTRYSIALVTLLATFTLWGCGRSEPATPTAAQSNQDLQVTAQATAAKLAADTKAANEAKAAADAKAAQLAADAKLAVDTKAAAEAKVAAEAKAAQEAADAKLAAEAKVAEEAKEAAQAKATQEAAAAKLLAEAKAAEEAKAAAAKAADEAEATSLLAQLTGYIKDNKLELADGALGKLDGMKGSLPASLQQQIETARSALAAKRATAMFQ